MIQLAILPKTNLQIQRNPYQNPKKRRFAEIGKLYIEVDPKMLIEMQKIQNEQNSLEKVKSWRTHTSGFQNLL